MSLRLFAVACITLGFTFIIGYWGIDRVRIPSNRHLMIALDKIIIIIYY